MSLTAPPGRLRGGNRLLPASRVAKAAVASGRGERAPHPSAGRPHGRPPAAALTCCVARRCTFQAEWPSSCRTRTCPTEELGRRSRREGCACRFPALSVAQLTTWKLFKMQCLGKRRMSEVQYWFMQMNAKLFFQK